MRLLLLLLTALAGCSFSAPDGGGAFACSAAAPECPPGTTCIDGTCRGGEEVADAATPPNGFAFRQKLRFDNRDNGTVAGAPVLVVLDPGVFAYTEAAADGGDLRFHDVDGAPLPHEIEAWNPAGSSFLWVLVPEVTGNSDQDYIWLYYGHPEPPAPPGGSVWAGYQAVYHLSDGAADSAAQGLDGVATGTKPSDGRVAGGLEFDGAEDHIVVGPDPPLLESVRAMSIEAWVRPSAPIGAGDQVVAAVSADGGDFSRAQIKIDPAGNVRAVFRTQDLEAENAVYTLDSALPEGQWTWVAVSADLVDKELRIVLNGGASVGSLANVSLDDITAATTPDQALISADETGGEGFSGVLDEIRIAGRAPTSDWLRLQYASMIDQLVTIEVPEAL